MKRKNLVLIFALFALCLLVPNYIFADSGDNESTWATLTVSTNNNTWDTIQEPQILIDTGTKTIYVSGYVDTWASNTWANSTWDTATWNINTWDTNTWTFTPATWSNLTFEEEFALALSWMYNNWLTMYNNSGDYRMYDLLTREEAAKIIWQAYNVFGLDTGVTKNTACTFEDSNLFNPTLSSHIANVCKWWLFQGSNWKYLPRENLTKAQAMAVLVRMIEWKMSYELQTPWREQYYNKWKMIGLTNVENINEFDHDLTRYEIALMVYRMRTIMENNQMKQLALNAMAWIENNKTGVIDSQTVIDNLWTLVWGIDPSTDPELAEAIYWMYDNWLTIYKTVADFKPFDVFTREWWAKIFDKLSDMLGLWTSNNYLPNECNFTDINVLSEESQQHIVNVCKKWLIKWSNWKFNPYENMNKSTFIVALIRMFEWKTLDETTTPWWKNYFEKAEELWLVTAADTTTFDTPISRYEVALFLYKFNVRYKMLNNLNNNRISDQVISTVSGSVLENWKVANIYINTSLLKQWALDLWYIEVMWNRYKIVKSKETSYYSNGFVWYGDMFDVATDEKIWTINFMVMNNYVIEWKLRFTDKTYEISWVEGTSAYYKITQI